MNTCMPTRVAPTNSTAAIDAVLVAGASRKRWHSRYPLPRPFGQPFETTQHYFQRLKPERICFRTQNANDEYLYSCECLYRHLGTGAYPHMCGESDVGFRRNWPFVSLRTGVPKNEKKYRRRRRRMRATFSPLPCVQVQRSILCLATQSQRRQRSCSLRCCVSCLETQICCKPTVAAPTSLQNQILIASNVLTWKHVLRYADGGSTRTLQRRASPAQQGR